MAPMTNTRGKKEPAPPMSELDRLYLVQLVAERKQIIMCSDGKAESNRRKNDEWAKVSCLRLSTYVALV